MLREKIKSFFLFYKHFKCSNSIFITPIFINTNKYIKLKILVLLQGLSKSVPFYNHGGK